jgi:hypothetical protein
MINYCSSNLCLHNGLCVPLVDAYRCVCLDDYIGTDCEKASDECLSNPCLNNGTCIDGVWNYTCQCPLGFSGSNCHLQKNYCESSPCVRGMCVNKVNCIGVKNRQTEFAIVAEWIRLYLSVVILNGCSLRDTSEQVLVQSLLIWWNVY